MARYSPSIQNLIAQLSSLPGIGGKSAQRLAFHILAMDDKDAEALTSSIMAARQSTKRCTCCQNFTDSDPCPICSDPLRDKTTILVVESPRDVSTFERAHEYKGLYHVLHGVISPMNDISPEDICIKELIARLGDGTVKEVIMATNPTVEGEATSMYISKLIKPLGIKVTRLAYGIPVGAELEFADEFTLIRAIEGRKDI